MPTNAELKSWLEGGLKVVLSPDADLLILSEDGSVRNKQDQSVLPADDYRASLYDDYNTLLTALRAKVVDSWGVGASSASTDPAESVEPLVMECIMAGAGGVGGRARFQMGTNVVLGSWANALKGMTVFGPAGAVTGLGSAVVAELTLSAGTTEGTYAPLELELNLGTGAKTGTLTSLIHASVNGAAAGEFDDNGVILNLQGLTISSGHAVQAAAVSDIDSTHAMKIKIDDTLYYIPLHTSPTFAP